MIVYHGMPLGIGKPSVQRIVRARHVMISYATCGKAWPEWVQNCASFTVDNGAFSAWKSGVPFDEEGFYSFARTVAQHPAFDWFLTPDVIDGDEEANDLMLARVPDDLARFAVPVFHLHESTERLAFICRKYGRVSLGSSGEYAHPGSKKWWARIHELWPYITPGTKVHGLRMASVAITEILPFSSVDSTTAGRHGQFTGTLKGHLARCSAETRMTAIAESMERKGSKAGFFARTYTPPESPQKQGSLL